MSAGDLKKKVKFWKVSDRGWFFPYGGKYQYRIGIGKSGIEGLCCSVHVIASSVQRTHV